MNRIPSAYFKLTTLILLIFVQVNLAKAQTPEIPPSVLFGGITVKFDRNAQNLIEEDIRSLMSNKKFWEEKLDRAILYFPIVESILMDEEVPIDFKYLAVQESSFKPDVVSSSNAVGFWQFKPETAIELNLRVDKDVDERKNISSSTHAAAWYLKKNNQQLNNWVSALYSYYQGVGGVRKLVPANWAYAREVVLTGKTDRYMLRFFAHKIALEAGLDRYRSANNMVLIESEYGKGKTFAEIAKYLEISEGDLKSYNRWVSDNKIPTDREYLLTVPVATNQVAFVRSKLSLPEQTETTQTTPTLASTSSTSDATGFPSLKKSGAPSNDKGGYSFFEINGLPGIEARAGDTDKSLASAGKLRTAKFRRFNDLTADMPVIPGNIYYLAKKNKKAATPFHTAKTGDSWQSISQQYGLRLVNLLKYNRTISKTYPIQTGQVVWLNKKRPKNQPVEIIKQKPEEQVTEPAIASAPSKTQPSATNDIPANAAGRKKYTPVLVDKNESSIAKENQAFQPGVTPAAPATSAPAKTVEVPVVASKPSTNTNDRVVIITQDGNDGSFKPADEPKEPTARPAAKPAQKPVARRSADADLFSTPSENASRTPANTQPVAFDNPLPPVKEKPAVTSARESNVFHTVEQGQTFYSISRMNNLTVKELLALNNLNDVVKLSVGQKLIVKKASGVAATSKSGAEVERSANTSGPRTHTVAAGETLFRISQNYQVSVEEIQKLNKLSGNTVKVGQKLKIP
ncbi:LysM peptidoglycan-binding domain-containing protein [Dyadobacter sp. CY345]|uniref:LysM peptidoglycan-binding domain-containing protein n=1 Tax=Dyadobacter sp. CY345 TaxID=2909335 RepID=UPI001F2BB178|nr:LysM peptidoglycan-binding domain-containing protein [Dyadobacter sp. CY345]MCF2442544.1 LysM peptidoglycan-binding domain-containing protein [Dyadobacter sp. CY345]